MLTFRLAGTLVVGLLVTQVAESRAADVGGPAFVLGNWDGLYLGALAGYDNTSFDWHEDAGGSGYDGNINSFSGGVFGGYNYEVNRFVLGVEGEASLFSGGEEFTSVPGPGNINADPDWELSVKGRLGYDAGRFMPYVAVGYSWMKLNTTWVQEGPDGDDVNVSETHQGFMAGIGTDIAITENLFGRLEYIHTWLSEERYSYCSVCSADIKLGQNSFRLGLGYRF
jgi:outer membrane immunogenic protein